MWPHRVDDPAWLRAQREVFDREGYVVVDEVLDDAAVDRLRIALQGHFDTDVRGRNDFEGMSSNRVYGLLAKSSEFVDLAMHPLPLAFAEADLGASFLLSACLAINLLPGESEQPWHTDDGYVRMPPPRTGCALSAFWAVDDTTAENGATQVLPGSHLWTGRPASDVADFGVAYASVESNASTLTNHVVDIEPVSVPLTAGSVMLAKGSLWHRGGANKTDRPRCIITPQYCAGWMRQIEHWTLTIPPADAAALDVRVRELLGYSIHPPFIGYVDGMHPKRLVADH